MGALFGVYVSIWTVRPGGSWPLHSLALDALLTIAISVLVVRERAKLGLVPLAATYIHCAVQSRLVPRPHSTFDWGVLFVATGFAILATSLAVSQRLRVMSASDELDAALRR